jgi:hypothetical protein
MAAGYLQLLHNIRPLLVAIEPLLDRNETLAALIEAHPNEFPQDSNPGSAPEAMALPIDVLVWHWHVRMSRFLKASFQRSKDQTFC